MRANGHPALAASLPDDGGQGRGYGIMVLTVEHGAIATISAFPDPHLCEVFGLPATPQYGYRCRNGSGT